MGAPQGRLLSRASRSTRGARTGASPSTPIVLGSCLPQPSPPSSPATRRFCASPTTTGCAGCCARFRAAAGTRRERAWCVPLGPDQAEALARLFAGLAHQPRGERPSSSARSRAAARRRRRDECLVDLARPDEDWWLSFATDSAPEQVAALLEHPDARELPAIGRALVPLDDHAAGVSRTSPRGRPGASQRACATGAARTR